MNERIRVPEIRLIDERGGQVGVVKTMEALRMAREKGFDLILISPGARPPVAKLGDFGKYKYELNKHEKELRKSQKSSVLKEVKLSPKIGQHDLNVRIRRTKEFLQKRHKVKVSVFFRGREMVHKEIGRRVLYKLVEAVKEEGAPEGRDKFEGRNLILLIVPGTQHAKTKDKESSEKKV